MNLTQYPIFLFLTASSILSVVSSTSLYGQFGAGAGVSSIGESVQRAGGEFESLFEKRGEELTYNDISGEVGFYGMVGARLPIGAFRIAPEVSYNYFQASRIKLSSLTVNDDTTVSATFEVGTSLIPVSMGIEYLVPIRGFNPYLGLYPTYTFVNRTYTRIEGDQISGLENASAGENEFGLGAEFGLEFGLAKSLWLNVRLRYTLLNALTTSDLEKSSGLLQLGTSLWFGDIRTFGDSPTRGDR